MSICFIYLKFFQNKDLFPSQNLQFGLLQSIYFFVPKNLFNIKEYKSLGQCKNNPTYDRYCESNAFANKPMCGENEQFNNGKGLVLPYDDICKGTCQKCQSKNNLFITSVDFYQ